MSLRPGLNKKFKGCRKYWRRRKSHHIGRHSSVLLPSIHIIGRRTQLSQVAVSTSPTRRPRPPKASTPHQPIPSPFHPNKLQSHSPSYKHQSRALEHCCYFKKDKIFGHLCDFDFATHPPRMTQAVLPGERYRWRQHPHASAFQQGTRREPHSHARTPPASRTSRGWRASPFAG